MSTKVYGKITVIKRNGSSGSQFPITSSNCTFGRDADCEIRIQLPTVSGRECSLRADENGNFAISKINQEGEVKVNNEVLGTDCPIKHNDVLTIAGRSFRFEYPPRMMSEDSTNISKTPKVSAIERVKQSQSRRVSFGPQLSPEQFVANLPPNTPVKKGAIPMLSLGNTGEANRRQSNLRDKRKSKGTSPKTVKNDDSAPKTERKRSFDELVALVGLDKAPKDKTISKRRSSGKQKRQNDVAKATTETPASTESRKTPKRRSKSSAEEVASMMITTPPAAPKQAAQTPIDAPSPDLFTETRTPKGQSSRRSSKGSRSSSKLDDTVPVVSSVDQSDAAMDDTQPIRMEEASVLDDTVPVRTSSGGIIRKSLDATVPVGELSQDGDVESIESGGDTDDTLPYEEVMVPEVTTTTTDNSDVPKLVRSSRISMNGNIDMGSTGRMSLSGMNMGDVTPSSTPHQGGVRKTPRSVKKTPDGAATPVTHASTGNTTRKSVSGVNMGDVSSTPQQEVVRKTPRSAKKTPNGAATPDTHTDADIDSAKKSFSGFNMGDEPPTTPQPEITRKTPKSLKKTPTGPATPAPTVLKINPALPIKTGPIEGVKNSKTVEKNEAEFAEIMTPVQKIHKKTPKSGKSTKSTSSDRIPLREGGEKTPQSDKPAPIFEEVPYSPDGSQFYTVEIDVGTPMSVAADSPMVSRQNPETPGVRLVEIDISTPASATRRTSSRSSMMPKMFENYETTPVAAKNTPVSKAAAAVRTPIGKTPKSAKNDEVFATPRSVAPKKTPVSVAAAPRKTPAGKTPISKKDVVTPQSAASKKTPIGKTPKSARSEVTAAVSGKTPNTPATQKTPKGKLSASPQLVASKKTPISKAAAAQKVTPKLVQGTDKVATPQSVASKKAATEGKTPKSAQKSTAPKKTPRAATPAKLAAFSARATAARSASKRRRSGVTLWSEIVRRNADKQPEKKEVEPPVQVQKKRPRKPVPKTSQQIQEQRHVDSPATIYIGRTERRRHEVTPIQFNMDEEYSSEESFMEEDQANVIGSKTATGEDDKHRQGGRPKSSPVSDNFGTARLMKTPKVKGEEVMENFGTKRLFKTPKVKLVQTEIVGDIGIRNLVKTPKVKGQPVEDHLGTKRLMQTPKDRIKGQPVEDHFGTKRLLKTPKEKIVSQPVDDEYGFDVLYEELADEQTDEVKGNSVKRGDDEPMAHETDEPHATRSKTPRAKNVKTALNTRSKTPRAAKAGKKTSSDDIDATQEAAEAIKTRAKTPRTKKVTKKIDLEPIDAEKTVDEKTAKVQKAKTPRAKKGGKKVNQEIVDATKTDLETNKVEKADSQAVDEASVPDTKAKTPRRRNGRKKADSETTDLDKEVVKAAEVDETANLEAKNAEKGDKQPAKLTNVVQTKARATRSRKGGKKVDPEPADGDQKGPKMRRNGENGVSEVINSGLSAEKKPAKTSRAKTVRGKKAASETAAVESMEHTTTRSSRATRGGSKAMGEVDEVASSSRTSRSKRNAKKLELEPMPSSGMSDDMSATRNTRGGKRTQKAEVLVPSSGQAKSSTRKAKDEVQPTEEVISTRAAKSKRSKVTAEPAKKPASKRKTPSSDDTASTMPNKKVRFNETSQKKDSAPIGKSDDEPVNTATATRTTRGRGKPTETVPVSTPRRGTRKQSDLEAIKEVDESTSDSEPVGMKRTPRAKKGSVVDSGTTRGRKKVNSSTGSKVFEVAENQRPARIRKTSAKVLEALAHTPERTTQSLKRKRNAVSAKNEVAPAKNREEKISRSENAESENKAAPQKRSTRGKKAAQPEVVVTSTRGKKVAQPDVALGSTRGKKVAQPDAALQAGASSQPASASNTRKRKAAELAPVASKQPTKAAKQKKAPAKKSAQKEEAPAPIRRSARSRK